MKGIVFFIDGCPYCRNARKALADLIAENPDYGKAEIEWVNEEMQPERTKGFDYYYVPTFFIGEQKVYEASPGDDYEKIRGNIKRGLDLMLKV